MNTLTYWVAFFKPGCTYQGRPPRLHGRTEEEIRFKMERPRGYGPDSYEEPYKVTIEYLDAFDLFDNAERFD